MCVSYIAIYCILIKFLMNMQDVDMIGSSCRAAAAELPRQALGCQSRSLGSFL